MRDLPDLLIVLMRPLLTFSRSLTTILLLMLRPQLQGLFAAMRGDTLKMSAAGLLMAAVCLAARPLLPLGSRAALGVWLLGLIGAACLLYFVVLKLLHCSMLDEMLGMLKRKVKKA